MDDVFYIDVKDGVNISYHQLIEDVRNTSVYNPYCKEESYYEVFKNIVTLSNSFAYITRQVYKSLSHINYIF